MTHVLAAALLTLPLAAAAQHPDSARPARDSVRLAEITVVGARAALAVIPGSAEVIGLPQLRAWHPATVNEVLRRVPGVVMRDEEGLGLRPNIGIRGLNPTRSSKVLLLEDGIPLALAPYGDNSSYYHPPINRFERIELLKGSGQILFGPQTVGGVINYITPPMPAGFQASLGLRAGTRGTRGGQLSAGTRAGPLSVLGSLARDEARGSRDHTGTTLEDATLKGSLALGGRHTITLRGNAYRERSNVTYSGLTEAEWAADPRGNAFVNDSMFLDRAAFSLSHRVELSGRSWLTTTAYSSQVRRHWWRQSSNSAERPNDAADSACGGMQNLVTTCGNEGRLRFYRVYGVEPRLRFGYDLGPLVAAADAGVRLHTERQQRRQLNGDSPLARNSAVVAEDNHRDLTAWSAFVQNRLFAGRWTITPGLRLEHIAYRRRNVLADVSGRTSLTQLVPGLGLTYAPADRITVFAGVHRGFSPPRTEDVISNSTGEPVELNAELSWNSELGLRAELSRWLTVNATLFRLDFENQVVAASVAGGTGAALTNAGQTLQQGAEVSLRAALAGGLFFDAAVTWLPVARFEGERYVYVGTGGSDLAGKVYAAQNSAGTRARMSVSGRRLPYAPAASLTAAAGLQRRRFDARLEAVIISRQFADPLNTTVRVADGQQGELPATAVWNAAVTYRLPRLSSSVFVSGQNLFDRLYIADRTRGLLPGAPRRIQAGVQHEF